MSILPSSKPCTKCGERKPLTDFYQKRPGQSHSQCKECMCAAATARWEAKRDARRAEKAAATEKACTRCGTVKSLGEFSRRGNGYKSACRTCRSEAKAEYSAQNHDRIRAAAAAYRDSKKEEIAERLRLWREAHPAEHAAIRLKSRRKHKDRVNADTHKRRAALKGGGSYTSAEWQELKAVCEFRCLMCGRAEPEIKLTVDHIVPVVAGGSNTIDNLQPLCKSCNSRKHRQELDLRTT